MATSEVIQQRIDEIDTMLAAGVKSSTVGDRMVVYDLEALQAERDRLLRSLSRQSASSYRRVTFKNA